MVKNVLLVTLVALVAIVATAWLKLRGPEIPYEALDAKYAGSGSGYADLPGGVHMHYQAAGDPAQPVILLVHSYGDSFTSWESWSPVLAKEHRVIGIDLPGHRLAPAPDG